MKQSPNPLEQACFCDVIMTGKWRQADSGTEREPPVALEAHLRPLEANGPLCPTDRPVTLRRGCQRLQNCPPGPRARGASHPPKDRPRFCSGNPSEFWSAREPAETYRASPSAPGAHETPPAPAPQTCGGFAGAPVPQVPIGADQCQLRRSTHAG